MDYAVQRRVMPHDVERYLRVRSAYSPSYAVDDSLVYLSDVTGVAQIWRLDEPMGWQHQLSFYDEPVSYAVCSPSRDELAFGIDEGGDERTQIHLMSLDGTDVRKLTRDDDAIHRWGGWSQDGDRVAYTSNSRDPSVFDVYVHRRDEREGSLVLETDGWYSVSDWSPDGDRLLVREAISNFHQELYVVDVETESSTHVTPGEPARWGSAEWTEDGVYVVTDSGRDTTYLVRLDPESGEAEAVVDGGEYEVEGVRVSDDGGRLAYSVNVEGYSHVYLATTRPFESEGRLDLPRCVVGGTSFSSTGELAVTTTSRGENANVHSVADSDSRPTRWTRAATAGVDPGSFVDAETTSYESHDGLEIPALLSLPSTADAEPPYPVVVDLHGGPESQRRPSFSGLRQYLLAEGYALFEPNVRGSTGYGREYASLDDGRRRMDAVRDVGAALDYLEGHEDVDAERAAAYGGSYGGFLVLAALVEYPGRWAAGVDVVGIANFVSFLENTGEWRRELREAEYGSLDGDRDFLESISPVNQADRIRAPLLVMHGENDPRVPVDEARQIAGALRANDVPVEEVYFEDEGHGFSKLDNRIEAYTRMAEFLDEHV
ncbi:MAG: S9 family peptidase [Halobacteriota archaeon]